MNNDSNNNPRNSLYLNQTVQFESTFGAMGNKQGRPKHHHNDTTLVPYSTGPGASTVVATTGGHDHMHGAPVMARPVTGATNVVESHRSDKTSAQHNYTENRHVEQHGFR